MPELFQPGSLVGDRYEIIRALGSGGFATIFEARHLHIGRLDALKILNLTLDTIDAPEFEERFMLEARAAARIEHPNVVTIYDFGFTGERRMPFMAMQLLQGHDLLDELEQHGPLQAERALNLMAPCLEGLAEAHAMGVVHKDLKPSNLFVRSPGERRELLCILDFGLARVEDLSRLTSSSNMMGTPKYLAPEYIQRQVVSPALDVYQMGLILAEMLIGDSVVQADNTYTCMMMHCTPGALKIPAPLADSPLGPILSRALLIEPEHRYPDAEALLDALDALDPDDIPPFSPDAPLRPLDAITPAPRPTTPARSVAGIPSESTLQLHRVGPSSEDDAAPAATEEEEAAAAITTPLADTAAPEPEDAATPHQEDAPATPPPLEETNLAAPSPPRPETPAPRRSTSPPDLMAPPDPLASPDLTTAEVSPAQPDSDPPATLLILGAALGVVVLGVLLAALALPSLTADRASRAAADPPSSTEEAPDPAKEAAEVLEAAAPTKEDGEGDGEEAPDKADPNEADPAAEANAARPPDDEEDATPTAEDDGDDPPEAETARDEAQRLNAARAQREWRNRQSAAARKANAEKANAEKTNAEKPRDAQPGGQGKTTPPKEADKPPTMPIVPLDTP